MKKTQLEENSMKTQWNFNEDIRSSSVILQSDENLTEVPTWSPGITIQPNELQFVHLESLS